MIWQKIHHWFIPHKETHKKARLISWEALLIYVLFFIFLQVGFSIVGYSKPGILGITSNVDQKKLIELTNKERSQKGLPPVLENEALNKAAALKAQNMFEENYWAHFAPSGKTPWDFILGSGYKFTYAGENLAKNFYASNDVVSAWMASPTHRDNLLNSSYQDIGIAVVDGVLNGERTTLVVQEFGSTQILGTQPLVNSGSKKSVVPVEEYNKKPQLLTAFQSPQVGKPLLDPFQASRGTGIGIIFLITILLMVDLLVLKRRGVFRLSSNHTAHMAIMSVALTMLLTSKPGSIL
ncbi:MAG: CAP domain-containing protein [Patescibacteria group bacterium]